MILCHLNEDIEFLNGSVVTQEEIDSCQRKYLNFYAFETEKPARYYDLEELRKRKLEELKKSKTCQTGIKSESQAYLNFKIKNIERISSVCLDANNQKDNEKIKRLTKNGMAWSIPSINFDQKLEKSLPDRIVKRLLK